MELGNPDLMKPYQITNLPVTLLIDREGKIADTHVGMAASNPGRSRRDAQETYLNP
jgi:hypothetical protein